VIAVDDRQRTLSSFDWQWAHLATGDFMPGDPWFDANSASVLARELCAIEPSWFRGRRVLDAGCGQGRWARALLELGAEVTAVDFSEAGLARTRDVCANHPQLKTRQIDLLDIPPDLAADRFDLVFSFGVLHHTGDTWRALENVSRLVSDSGALFLYLYGSSSWDERERVEIERVRRELAPLTFQEKVIELQRRYPGQDPHQLFDLLSPVINDRVGSNEVERRLQVLGFDLVVQTVASGEVYLRATRAAFPSRSLGRPVGEDSAFARESAARWLRRAGAAFDGSLRDRLAEVPTRNTPQGVLRILEGRRSGSRVDVSFPPDRVNGGCSVADRVDDAVSPARPGALASVHADVVLALGASIGACRYPREFLLDLWGTVNAGGILIVELPDSQSLPTRRSLIDKVLTARRPVPEKVARLMTRHDAWTTGHALHAIGGVPLLNPIVSSEGIALLHEAGAEAVETVPGRIGTSVVVARSLA
jgi:SAM-dependent methyltransferase